MVEVVKQFNLKGTNFLKGHMYVCAEDIESQYRSIHGDCLGMSYPIEQVYRPYKGEDLNDKKLMAWRTGGVGDILFINPVLRYLKKKYPTCHLRFASACKESLENVPEVNELYSMPFDAALLKDCDYHLMFQGIIEGQSEESKRTHAVDLFFSYFGIDSTHLPVEDKKPKLFFNQVEMEWLSRTLKNIGITDKDFVVGIQMESSSPLRNYPKEKLKAIVDFLLREENTKIVMIGSDQHTILGQWYKSNKPNVIVATNYNVRQSITLAFRYNLIIAPDSFMVQIAGALDKPLIGLYGPFPSEVRMKYFKNAIGFDPKVACSPCYEHDFRSCIRGFPSPCFSLMAIEDVLQAVDYLKFKSTGSHFNYMGGFLLEPNMVEAEKYMMSADKGLCFFPGYYTHSNIVRVDTNKFVKPDISDLSTQFERDKYPFVVYMREFGPNHISTYQNSRTMVRPGGYFIVYKRDSVEGLHADLQKDIGNSGFVLLYAKFDPTTRETLIISQKPY